MSLKSKAFAGDPLLEAAAVSDAAHIVPGTKGEHVARIQRALMILDKADLVADGSYGPKTAAAVLRFKQKRNIINRKYQTQADNIVGIMTMTALDKEMQSRVDPTVMIGRLMFAVSLQSTSDVRSKALTATTNATNVPVTSIRSIIRNNPYTPTGVNLPIELPPSVPPTKTYAVEVTIDPPLTGDDFMELSIVNGSTINGTATISPARIMRSSTVIVTGGTQTMPKNGGRLQIQAKLNGQDVKATSEGFSVCAHPLNVQATFARDVNGVVEQIDKVGMIVKVTMDSDGKNFSDLDQVEVSELIETFNRNMPPFKDAPENPSGYTPVIPPQGLSMVDTHAEPRPSAGPRGTADKIQMHIFRCARCGANDKPVPNSGFDVLHEVFQDPATKKFRHKVTKKGTKIGMRIPGTQTIVKTNAGTATIVSPIHDL